MSNLGMRMVSWYRSLESSLGPQGGHRVRGCRKGWVLCQPSPQHELSPHEQQPPNPRCRFPWLRLPAVNWGPKMLNGKFQKQRIRKFYIPRCSEEHDEISRHPGSGDMTRPFVRRLPAVEASRPLVAVLFNRLTVAVSQCLCSGDVCRARWWVTLPTSFTQALCHPTHHEKKGDHVHIILSQCIVIIILFYY